MYTSKARHHTKLDTYISRRKFHLQRSKYVVVQATYIQRRLIFAEVAIWVQILLQILFYNDMNNVNVEQRSEVPKLYTDIRSCPSFNVKSDIMNTMTFDMMQLGSFENVATWQWLQKRWLVETSCTRFYAFTLNLPTTRVSSSSSSAFLPRYRLKLWSHSVKPLNSSCNSSSLSYICK